MIQTACKIALIWMMGGLIFASFAGWERDWRVVALFAFFGPPLSVVAFIGWFVGLVHFVLWLDGKIDPVDERLESDRIKP